MACPFFLPTHKSDDAGWLHPSRLPLGAGWSGHCCAPGHVGATPSQQEIREQCNLGHATCSRLPAQRAADAIRFSVACERGPLLELWFVCELAHLPASHGKLQYNLTQGQWLSRHPEPHIQKMAECYVESYLQRKVPMEIH